MLFLKLFAALFLWVVIPACGGGGNNDGSSSGNVNPDPTPMPMDNTVVLDCGDIQGGISNNNLDNEAKSYLLCKHNQSRSEVALGEFSGSNGNLPAATNMKRLQWSDELEQVAQNWADQCMWQHNSNRRSEYNALAPTDIHSNPIGGGESVGENLAFFSSSQLTSARIDFAVNGYNAWVDEGDAYSYGELNVSDFCGDSTCGHFTQVIWANTYKVGCAVNFCAAGTVSNFSSTYLVCNYASAGNFIGQEPYSAAVGMDDVCSTAGDSQTVCRNGLTESENYQTGL